MIGDKGLNNLVWFMGYIEVASDDTNNDRVKVRAFGFHPTVTSGEVSKEDLPWASVVRQSTDVYTPFNEGDLAFGFFLDGRDAQHPVVLGVINTSKYGTPSFTPGEADSQADAEGNPNTPASIGRTECDDLPPHARAFLDSIQSVEAVGGDNGYNLRNGGSTFDYEQGHPGYSKGPGGTSSASGRYQFTYDTWKELNGGKNVPMTKCNQDAAGWLLAQQRYKNYTGGDLNSELLSNGLSDKILSDLGRTWEAFTLSDRRRTALSTYTAALGDYANGVVPTETAPENSNEYVAASHTTVETYGNSALPAQVTGEDIDKTPVVPATTMRKDATTRSGAQYVSEPGVPVSGSKKTAVWAARRNGSFIELHAGQNGSAEFINIMHNTGSSVRLDQNGNVTVKSAGRTHMSSENNYEVSVEGATTVISNKGYTISVSAGGVTIDSDSDINLTSGGNISIQAAGDLLLNAGGSVDVAGGRLGLHSRTDNLNLVAAGTLALQSDGSIGLKSGIVGIQANGIGLKAAGNLNLKGGKIYLNDAAGTPADVPDAEATRTPEPPTPGICEAPDSNTNLTDPAPEGISPGSLDDAPVTTPRAPAPPGGLLA